MLENAEQSPVRPTQPVNVQDVLENAEQSPVRPTQPVNVQDVLENAEQGLVPSSSCPTSTASSPVCGSRGDLLPGCSYQHLSLTVTQHFLNQIQVVLCP